jgi:protein-L-isoaspartate(D-aspartate) O-methyltransferase
MELWNNCKIVTLNIDMKLKMDLEQTRFNMVEQQIRPWDVLDQKVLNLLFINYSSPLSHSLAASINLES